MRKKTVRTMTLTALIALAARLGMSADDIDTLNNNSACLRHSYQNFALFALILTRDYYYGIVFSYM